MKTKQIAMDRIVSAMATFVMFAGFMVLLGWKFDSRPVLSIIPGLPTMKFNTALGFLLCGSSLLLSLKRSRLYARTGLFFNGIVLLIGSVTLVEYIFSFNSGIDTFFNADPYSEVLPGRMSAATALCFVFFGISLINIHAKERKIPVHFVEFTLLLIMLIALVAIFAYVLNVPGNEKFPFLESMALHTSVLFIVLSLARSFRNSMDGSMGYFFGSLSGNRLVRRILPLVVVFPLILGVLFLYAVNHLYMNMELGIVLFCVLCSVVLAVNVGFLASRLNEINRRQLDLQYSLENSNRKLQYFKQALDQSSLVAFVDPDGVITEVNDRFCEVSKYSKEELIGQTLDLIRRTGDSEEFFNKMWCTLKKGEAWMGGIKNRAKDGSLFWVHAIMIPFKDEAGNIYQYLTFRQDITKFKMLSSQYEGLKQKNKELEQFTYIASHDLQEPLNTISAMVRMIQSYYWKDLNEDSKKFIKFIDESTTRMSELIKGLLDYSRIGNAKKLETINSTEVLTEVKHDLQSSIQEAGAELSADELPVIKAYKIEFRLLLQNLIGNAIKFRKPGIGCKIHVSASRGRSFWKFSVHDNGIGMEQNLLSKIFGMFQRLHGREDYEGTGIGLAHSEKIVNLHGGDIWVDSKPGEGSTFFFTIPVNLN